MSRKTSTTSEQAEKATSTASHKVGDVVEIPKVASAMVRLPDGSVTTTRGTYTVRHTGEHAIVTVNQDGTLHETTFTAEQDSDE